MPDDQHEQLSAALTPALDKNAFQCPASDCGVYAQMKWSGISAYAAAQPEWKMARCGRCGKHSLWYFEDMVHPPRRVGPKPAMDMPEQVLRIYDEARSVAPLSKKSAAGLLRLALQMLVDDIEPGSGDINSKIGKLVQGGLDPQVQQAMDVLRVVGNESVHPGQIDLEADDALLPALFGLVNLIVEQVVSRPKHLAGLFGMLPEGKRNQIAQRDKTVPE